MRREIRQYLKELSIDDVTEFSNSKEFEKTYFMSLIKPAKPPPEKEADPMLDIPADVVKLLNQSEFNFDAPFAEEVCEIEISLDKATILKSNSSKIFGKIVTELVAKTTPLPTFVHKEFAASFSEFQKALTLGKRPEDQIVLMTNENKKIWITELSVRVEGKSTILLFHDITKKVAKAMGRLPADNKEPQEEKKTIQPLDMVIFRYTNIQDSDPKKWVTKAATLLKKAGLWPVENRTKFIAVRYEDDPREKAEFSHPFIDDLICLPLDRLILLQKIEIALALPKKVSPSYLYVQNVEEFIEISKKAIIERVSDLGLAITNPIPLAQGTIGHFYFRFPGQKTLMDLYGKVCTSIPHPDRAGEYLAYFNFFGLNKNANKEIKAFLTRDTAYKNLVDLDAENFRFNSENLFLTDEQKRKKTIAVLDFEESVIKSTTDYIKNEIDNVDVVSDDTYYSFYKRFLSRKIEKTDAPPATDEDFFAETVSILISASNLHIQMMMTTPKEEDRFFGHEILKLFSDPTGWQKLFDEDSLNLLQECIKLVETTKKISKLFEIQTADGESRAITLDINLEENSSMVRLSFKLPDTKMLQRNASQSKIESLDCVVIEYDLLPKDVNAFINSLTEAAKNVGLSVPPGGPKVIVTVSETRNINFQKLLDTKVYGFMYKPLEIRRLLYLIATAVESVNTIYTFENIGWKKDNIAGKIARNSNLCELSEFGATVRSEQPIKPGTMLYLFKSIFVNAPDQNLCARVYHSEEDSKNAGHYLNSMIYFGITDAFLKYTRAYIRETYAANKSKETQSS